MVFPKVTVLDKTINYVKKKFYFYFFIAGRIAWSVKVEDIHVLYWNI